MTTLYYCSLRLTKEGAEAHVEDVLTSVDISALPTDKLTS